jgi:hypothetical protein
MRTPIKLLSLTVWITVWLLVIGATLVLLGIFNEQLKWDIFSPQVEAVLYGIFFACIVLSLFGIAITFVLGIKQIVEAVESLRSHGDLDNTQMPQKARRLTYAGYMLGLFASFTALIGVLELVDHQIQIHRNQVFKQIAAEQMQPFERKISRLLSLQNNSPAAVPKSLPELMNALSELSFVRSVTLYRLDPQDNSMLWRYRPRQTDSKGKPFFDQLLVAKQFEKAIQQSLNNNTGALEALNQKTDFIWYYLVRASDKQPLAVLRVDGNSNENFRDYELEPTHRQN